MEIKQHSWVGNGAFRMWCEPLVENYWMSSEGLTQEFSPADTANIKKTLQRSRTAEGWKRSASMAGIFEGKDFAQPREFDESVAGIRASRHVI